MIFSYITGTPCIAINNSSKKVEGTFQFISKCNFIKMANNLTEAVEIIPMLMDIENCNLNEFVYPISILEEVLKNGAAK
jgi:pyruvyl transferase EpsI